MFLNFTKYSPFGHFYPYKHITKKRTNKFYSLLSSLINLLVLEDTLSSSINLPKFESLFFELSIEFKLKSVLSSSINWSELKSTI